MRFENYINEVSEEYVVDILKKDCKPFIKEISKGKRLLYRGSKKTVEDILMIRPRKNRLPLDMPEEIHEELDKLFKKKFGWKARSEGVFVSSDKYITDMYGKSYIFFPIGEYKYIWSKEVKDLWATARFITSDDIFSLNNIVDNYIDNKKLQDAILINHEITFKCKSYYLVNLRYTYSINQMCFGKRT